MALARSPLFFFLQVLEYLAASKILTPEQINGGPPCHGMERLEIFKLYTSPQIY